MATLENTGIGLYSRRLSRRYLLKGMAAGTMAGAAWPLLTACGGNRETRGSTASGGERPPAERQRGGSLQLYNPSGDLQRLDFQRTISTPTQNVACMVFNRLLTWDPYTDYHDYVIKPDLAESWEYTGDRVIFRLRREVKWQNLPPLNGRLFVASDVKYSLERVRTKGAEWVWAYKLEGVGRIETPDDYTVVLVMDQPSAVILSDLAHGPGMGIVPREVIEEDGDLDKRWVGTGAFIMERWEKGNFISFRRNPDYFKQGLPYLDDVRVLVISDAAAKLANFMSGQVAYHELADQAEIDQVSSLGAEVWQYNRLTASHKVYNAGANGPRYLQDLRVRQAIDAALDRQAIVDIAFGGQATWGGPVIPLEYGEWSLDESYVRETYAQDLSEAKKLLDAAGISSLEIPVEYSNVDNRAADELPLLKQQLAKIGIDVSLVPLERTIYLQKQVDADFELMAIGSGVGPDPDSLLFPYFHSRGDKNWGRVSDSELDRRIEQERATLDHDERLKLIQDLARDWKKYLYRTHTAYPVNWVAWQPNVVGGFIPKGADWQPLEEVSLA